MSFRPIPFVSTSVDPRVDEIEKHYIQTGQITVATTSNSDLNLIVPRRLKLDTIYVVGGATLTADDTNYITWTAVNITNSNAAMLSTADTNTTKATGGSTLTLNVARALIMTTTEANLKCSAFDVIRLRAAATGTLANTVTAYTATFTFSDNLYKG